MPGHLRGFTGATLLLGLILASCMPTRQAGSGTESGNVVGSIYTLQNRPAAGITVTLIPENPDSAGIWAAVTDDEGNYAFYGVLGAYSLFALDGAGNGLKVDFIQEDTATLIDLERLVLSPLASVSGYAKVIGVRADGELEPKVEIFLSGSPYRIQVDPNTGFLWSDLPAGRYWLNIGYSWSEGVSFPITLVPGETLNLDTVTLVNQYSSGISLRDTLKVSSSQLPLRFDDKLALNIGAVDSVLWVLNGERITSNRVDRSMHFILEAGMLKDSGYNVIEMRLYLPDTTVFRSWYIDFDDSRVIPWARHAVKGIFMGSETDPRPNNEGMQLGSFQILERRLLREAEMAFWNWSPVPGGDTALPVNIKLPMYRYEFGNPFECGEMSYDREPELFPGDTVTFLTAPNEFSGGMTFRIRKDEDYSSFGNLAWFNEAAWPLAAFSAVNGGTRDIRIEAEVLNVRLNLNLFALTSDGDGACLPLSRGFTIGADGIPNEYVAMPPGMSAGNLLLHFRAGLPNGLFTESLAASGDYVFIDSSGYGVAGSGAVRREVQLSVSEVAELRALLASLPAEIPIQWNGEYLEDKLAKDKAEDNSALLQRTDYLLSGGRGCLLIGEPRPQPVPEAKLILFQSVETWLRSHDLL